MFLLIFGLGCWLLDSYGNGGGSRDENGVVWMKSDVMLLKIHIFKFEFYNILLNVRHFVVLKVAPETRPLYVTSNDDKPLDLATTLSDQFML